MTEGNSARDESSVAAYPKPGSAACCCLGLVGNTQFMCIARGLDLDPPHCGPDCSQRPACVESHNADAERIKAGGK